MDAKSWNLEFGRDLVARPDILERCPVPIDWSLRRNAVRDGDPASARATFAWETTIDPTTNRPWCDVLRAVVCAPNHRRRLVTVFDSIMGPLAVSMDDAPVFGGTCGSTTLSMAKEALDWSSADFAYSNIGTKLLLDDADHDAAMFPYCRDHGTRKVTAAELRAALESGRTNLTTVPSEVHHPALRR